MAEMSEYFAKLAATMRAGLADDSSFFSATQSTSDEPMPDIAPSPELLNIVAMAQHGTLDIIELSDEDWQLLIDETFFQIARALRRDESIVLPNIGKIEIVWGEGGPYGRVTLDETAKPEVVL